MKVSGACIDDYYWSDICIKEEENVVTRILKYYNFSLT